MCMTKWMEVFYGEPAAGDGKFLNFAIQFSTGISLVLHRLSVLELVLINKQPEDLYPSSVNVISFLEFLLRNKRL
jgi:hypothetical protein